VKARASAGILAAVLLAAAALLSFRWVSSPPGGGREVLFPVPRGWGAGRIAGALQDSGLVRWSTFALWRAERTGVADRFQAGTYLLDSSMPLDTILMRIAEGRVVPVPTHWVTLPEGLTLPQSLQTLSASLGIPLDSLEQAAGDSSLLALTGAPGLEGYLFPETYEFADSLGAREVLTSIVDTGLRRWEPAWDPALERMGLSRRQAVVLASIVEREARVDSERPAIAGVFLLRLSAGMRLESCATVQFALGEVRERLSYADLRIDSPYNTYRHGGLPPGPICSPGTASLAAVADPDTTAGYLYFVSREDGSGTHLFARDLAGHLANIRTARSHAVH
jgi:UPF0755 protein